MKYSAKRIPIDYFCARVEPGIFLLIFRVTKLNFVFAGVQLAVADRLVEFSEVPHPTKIIKMSVRIPMSGSGASFKQDSVISDQFISAVTPENALSKT